MFIKKIKDDQGELLAKIFSHNLEANGVNFLTDQSSALQVGLIEHKEDTIIKAHKHAKLEIYSNCQTQEFIFVEKGKVKVKIYNNDFKLMETTMLRQGDFMLQVSGGHEFLIYKGARLIEVKQGAYPGDDKAKIYK